VGVILFIEYFPYNQQFLPVFTGMSPGPDNGAGRKESFYGAGSQTGTDQTPVRKIISIHQSALI
jgi:hypothetical protein